VQIPIKVNPEKVDDNKGVQTPELEVDDEKDEGKVSNMDKEEESVREPRKSVDSIDQR
jgi:hypothetical protein